MFLPIECPTCTDKKNAGNVQYACHHCGRLLCQNCFLEIKDNLFLGEEDEPVEAVHCKPCAKRVHGHDANAWWRMRWAELKQMKRDYQVYKSSQLAEKIGR